MNNYAEDNWDDNEFPLAYLITIRTYGTWLHGDERGSVDIHGKNIFGSAKISHNENLKNRMKGNLKDEIFVLDEKQREAVEESIKETCKVRGYELLAVNVRTNHLHAVISAQSKPEIIINGFKSHATRKLKENYLIIKDTRVWSRGGSRRYLWKKHHLDSAIDYVLYGQGLLPFELETVD
jgi:REP element-mobilizing transposase RayT